MRRRFQSRGYSLVEVLVTVFVLALLLFAVCGAVSHVVGAELLGASRQSALRSAGQLVTRLSEEARSSTAVFVPAVDVLGASNGTASGGGHEVDFYRKASDGTQAFVAYRFDSSAGTVTRYEYAPGIGGPQILNADVMAEGVTSMSALRTTLADVPGIFNGAALRQVDVYYGSSELDGGN
ncbi:MAG TPA: type II secretion system protein, partial [Candidatus Eremiobacteraceae bacterium]|nr:type II secretion system protein [Candidatus Eremiobacteraceae bacterium]